MTYLEINMNDSSNSAVPARDLCAFIEAGPSPYHAVTEAIRRLEEAGFTRLLETDDWSLAAGGAHYVTRSDASLIAFRTGQRNPIEAGFNIVGAHTDSPNLRIKPRPVFGKEGYVQLGVEVYGGVLLHTWLDRDLGIAGRVTLENAEGQLERRLVRLHEPLCRVPSLAIHLDREVNDKGLVLNKQNHLAPLFTLGDVEEAGARLNQRLAKGCGIEAQQIRGLDLGLYDLAPPAIGGEDGDFVFAPRLDNLASSHAATTALIGAEGDGAATRVVALFDHEEIGSASAQGAAGTFLRDVLGRIVESCGENVRGGMARAIASSFCISADMAHAVHPNFVDKHEPRHMPHVGRGPVIKSNVQQRYATDGYSAARFRTLCRQAEVPFQDFVTRTDLACGSTIGPITASGLGIATVDVGNPMLSMHSIREMSGAADVGMMIRVLGEFFRG